VAEQNYWDLFHPEFFGSQQTRMACNDVIVCAYKDRICPPHSRMDAAMLATCARLCVRGLFARGISRSIGQRSIWMSTLTAPSAGFAFAMSRL
jgi:hypothetical protein